MITVELQQRHVLHPGGCIHFIHFITDFLMKLISFVQLIGVWGMYAVFHSLIMVSAHYYFILDSVIFGLIVHFGKFKISMLPALLFPSPYIHQSFPYKWFKMYEHVLLTNFSVDIFPEFVDALWKNFALVERLQTFRRLVMLTF